MRRKAHVRFGGRVEETDQPKGRHRASARPDHTAASLLVSAGANVKVVQRHLGHSTATQTLDRYAHLFTEDLEAVADRLDQVWAAGNDSGAEDRRVVEMGS